jgi:hypothetical protein
MEVPVKIQPFDGIFLEYAPIRRDSHRPINDPACSENLAEIRTLKALVEYFGAKNSQVLEYWVDNSRFSKWTKPPQKLILDAEVIKRDVDFYAESGFESVTSFGCFLGDDYEALHGEPPVQAYGGILGH